MQKIGTEALLLEVKHENQKPFLLAYTYRLPSSSQNWTLEFESILEQMDSENMEIILQGDLNLNLLDKNNKVQNWLQIVDTINLTQLVETPTRMTATTQPSLTMLTATELKILLMYWTSLFH